MHFFIHCSIIINNQYLEIKCWTKYNLTKHVWYIGKGLRLSYKVGYNPVICNDIDSFFYGLCLVKEVREWQTPYKFTHVEDKQINKNFVRTEWWVPKKKWEKEVGGLGKGTICMFLWELNFWRGSYRDNDLKCLYILLQTIAANKISCTCSE